MIIAGTEINLLKPPRFVKAALGLLAVYWCYALYVLLREVISGQMGKGIGFSGEFRFFIHYVPQLFFIPWIMLNIFRKIPLFRTVPGVAFIAIGFIMTYQYGSYLAANLLKKEMIGLFSGGSLSIPSLWEIGIVLPLSLLVLATGIMLLVGKPERGWYY
ncbi:hypothetical protein KKF84_10775 [Myxococcota bacterium]|nr:hypothetical protein [Myxococcota bacterium]MBU1535795.1 hypothetical protein [Myxococcota bacterium]